MMKEPGQRAERRIFLSVPHMSGCEARLVEDCLGVEAVGDPHRYRERLEARIGERLGRPVAAVASGTAAIHLAVRIAGVRRGDEVVVPTLTFVASCNPVVYEGAVPVLMDSDRSTWNLDADLLAEFLERRAAAGRLPAAVIVVHLFGQSARIEAIRDVTRRHGVPLIEDVAEALGATVGGRALGTFGELAAFSLNRNKIITGMGGGFLAGSAEAVEEARHLSRQATRQAMDYEHTTVGYNYRMSELNLAVACAQFDLLDERVARRRAVFRRYRKGLADIPGLEPMPEVAGTFATHWLSCFLVDDAAFGCSARDLIRFLDAANVEARPVWKPMHLQPMFEACERVGGAVAEELNRRGICLPSSSCLTDDEVDFVIERIREAGNGRGV